MMAKNNKFKTFLKDKGFYLALALCIIGASAAAWATANKTLETIDERNRALAEQHISGEVKSWESSTAPITPPASNSEEDVAKVIPDVKKPVASSSSQSEPASSSEASTNSTDSSKQSGSEQKLEQAPYTLPMASLAVIEPYSNGELVKNKTLNVWRAHNAVDLGGELGATVVAVSDGVITSIGNDPLWGGFIEIKHPDGVSTSYSGVTADKSLKKGSTIRGGQKIGVLSEIPAEAGKGAHIHLAMQKNNAPVDPGLYLPLK